VRFSILCVYPDTSESNQVLRQRQECPPPHMYLYKAFTSIKIAGIM
jgi:hypothetical protein